MAARADGTIADHQRMGRLRVGAGLGLVVAAAVLAWAAMSSGGSTAQAWVARAPVPESGVVDVAQFQLADVTLPEPAVLWPATTVPSGAMARLGRVLGRQWQAEMQAHAQALARVRHLLTPQSQATLSGFLTAPPRGIARIQRFRSLGIRRSSTSGDILMLGAAFAGLL